MLHREAGNIFICIISLTFLFISSSFVLFGAFFSCFVVFTCFSHWMTSSSYLPLSLSQGVNYCLFMNKFPFSHTTLKNFFECSFSRTVAFFLISRNHSFSMNLCIKTNKIHGERCWWWWDTHSSTVMWHLKSTLWNMALSWTCSVISLSSESCRQRKKLSMKNKLTHSWLCQCRRRRRGVKI